MNVIYKSLNISKQAFFQYKERRRTMLEEREQLRLLVMQIRKDHPTMGTRDMYFKLCPESMGRDAFELFCKEEGFASPRTKNYRRTTDSTGVVRFDNMLDGLDIVRPDQVWQSDITYFELNNKFYYLTFIIDAYSRVIVGHSVSERLFTECTTLAALRNAILFRGWTTEDNIDLIFHSDGGGQYYAKNFLELTGAYHIKNSMCEYAWENGKAERINGVIKNNYLRHKQITSFNDLIKEVDRSVYLYNHEKPHVRLHRLSPIQYEKKLCQKVEANIQHTYVNIELLQPSSRVYKRLRSSPPLTKTEKVQWGIYKLDDDEKLVNLKNE